MVETHVAPIPRVPAPERIQYPFPGRPSVPAVHGGCRCQRRTESPDVDPEQPESDPGRHLSVTGGLLGSGLDHTGIGKSSHFQDNN